jgi:hypothetical protein
LVRRGLRRPAIRTPINPRVLEAAEHLVTAFLTVVLVSVVAAAYITLLRPGGGAGETAGAVATSTTTAPEGSTTTVTTAAPVLVPASPVSDTAAPAAAPSCSVETPTTGEGTMAVRVAFPCPGGVPGGQVWWVTRRVPSSERVLTSTLGEMVKGPSQAEQEAGFRSYWSTATADAFEGVTLSDGVAFVDLDPIPDGIPENAEAGARWLATTASTVFQFDTVRALELRTDGDCDAFWQSIGGTDCIRLRRTEWSRQLAQWRETTAGPPESRG